MTKSTARILLANADALILSAEIRLLTSAGIEVVSASSAQEALVLIDQNRPDLLLLDVDLPDMPGFDVCRRVRSDPRNAEIFIVLLSTSPFSDAQQAHGYQAGANAWIARPIADRELQARIQAYLRISAAEGSMRDSEQRFRLLADSASILIWSSGVDGSRDYFNTAWLQFTGRRLEQEMGGGWLEGMHPDDLPRWQSSGLEHNMISRAEYKLEYRLRRADGEYGWLVESAAPRFSQSGDFSGYLGSCVELGENQRAQENINNLKSAAADSQSILPTAASSASHVDAMPGITNSRYLRDIAEHEIAVARRYRQPLAVTRFDLDNFRKVNEAFGRSVGDQVLQRVCQTVRAEMRSADILGRSGDDDFVILQPVTSARNARVLAERIRAAVEALSIPVPSGLGTISLTISAGIDEVIQPGQDGASKSAADNGFDSVDELFQRAGQAMQSAKTAGRNRVVLHPRL